MPLDIHPDARISPMADIEESMRGTLIRIGAGSVVDSFVKFKPAGGSGDVVLGNHVTINSGCVFYTGNGIRIGDHTAIAANCVLAPVNHAYEKKDQLIRDQRFKPSKGGILIEEDVWIGAGCVILDGSILRKGCVIGAMSLVRGEVPAYTIWAGNPLRQVGARQ